MELNVLDIKGKKTNNSVKLSDKVFKVKPNDHAIWLDIRSIRANQRQGTHATKSRSMVAGGGRKPFRQKGTGRARQGTIREPQHVGGGTVFGPQPRIYHVGINKKVKLLARKSVLSYKLNDNKIIIVEDFNMDKSRTKEFKDVLTALNIDNHKVLFITAENKLNFYQSARNMHKVNVKESINFSTYDVLNAELVVMQKGAVDKINEVLGK